MNIQVGTIIKHTVEQEPWLGIVTNISNNTFLVEWEHTGLDSYTLSGIQQFINYGEVEVIEPNTLDEGLFTL